MAGNKYNEEFRIRIVNDFNNGLSQKEISEKYSVHKSTVSKIIRKHLSNKTLQTLHKGGRRRKTTEREDYLIAREIKKNPDVTAKEIKEALGLNASVMTIRRRAINSNLKSYKPANKPLLSKRHIKARLVFAKNHASWSSQKWKTVLFSDESKFNLRGSDGTNTIRRPPRQRYNPKYTRKVVKFGGDNVMVWGCFSAAGVGPSPAVEMHPHTVTLPPPNFTVFLVYLGL